jgi:hypothetical protein
MTKYWQIECTRHLETFFKTQVRASYLPEKNLEEFIRSIFCKYALSDGEILEECLRVPFKKKKEYVKIFRRNNSLGKPLSISFMAQVADISVQVWLTD